MFKAINSLCAVLNQINLNLLRSLQILLQERHVSRAAQRLHLTQSAVSRQLAQLRELCGDPLLVRDGNRLVLTTRAQALQPQLEAVLRQCDDLLTDVPFVPADWQDELVIASSDYIAQYVLPDISARLQQQAPGLSINYTLWQQHYLDSLADNGIHLASTMFVEPPHTLSYFKVGEDHSVCVMRRDHPLARHTALNVSQFTTYGHIKVTGGGDKDVGADAWLAQQGMHRNIVLKVPFFTAAINRLSDSDNLMVMPQHIADNLSRHWHIIHKPLPFSTRLNQYFIIWHPRYDNDPAHRWAREQMLQAFKHSDYSIQS